MDRRKTFMNTSVSNAGSNIKGLQLFIADLRASQQSDDQIKRIQSEIVKIKQHFSSASKKVGSSSTSTGFLGNDKFDGYQRKKYIAKLAYVYITSNTTMLNDILFGLDQTVELLKSNVFSEKFIGYMTLELLYRHQIVIDKVNDRVATQLIKDVACSNDDFAALALNFIGVTGKLASQLAFNEGLVSEVFQVLRSPTSSQYLKKKSAAAFLTLLKCNLLILTDDLQRKQIWIQRILSLLDDRDNYRLTLTTLPLVEFIARNIDPSYCTRLIPQLTEILYNCIVIGTSSIKGDRFPAEYKFANMPNPWLITKVVSLLDALIASPHDSGQQISHLESNKVEMNNINPENLGKLRMCVMEAINVGTRKTADPMEKIVQNTVLFSLINFASKLDPSNEAIANSASALCTLLNSNDINVRYLTLDSLVKLCSFTGKVAIDTVRGKNLNLIFHLLNNERDPSIVRKVIDLLYTFTDVDSVKIIVEHLITFILNSKHISDPKIKSDIAVKIAILTEKYSTDPSWFVVTTLKILSLSVNTSLNDEEIWQRLCQIVVNNPQLHETTCEKLVDYLYGNQVSEYILRTAAFLLGEYGNSIPGKISIPNLFKVFTDKYFNVSNITKAMILTTMIKLYKFSPDIGSVVIKFFQLEIDSLDIELQTRSYEYLKLIQISKVNQNLSILDIVLQPLPPFNSKSNPLLKRLGSLPTGSTGPISPLVAASGSSSTVFNNQPGDTTSTVSIQGNNENGTKSLTPQGTATTQVPRPPPPRQTRSQSVLSSSDITKNSNIDSKYSQLVLSTNWREGFSRMLQYKQGILFASPLLKVLYRVNSVELTKVEIVLTFINQTEWEITGLSTEVIPSQTQDNPQYILQNIQAPASGTIESHKRTDQRFEMVFRKPFSCIEAPIVSIYFKCGGSSNNLNLKLGVGVTTTLTNNAMAGLGQFVTRWRTLGDAMGKEGEHHIENVVISRAKNSNMESELSTMSMILKRMGFDIVEQSNIPNTLFVAGIIHTKSDGNYGCLIKASFQENAKFNLTCKTTTGGPLSEHILECIRLTLTT